MSVKKTLTVNEIIRSDLVEQIQEKQTHPKFQTFTLSHSLSKLKEKQLFKHFFSTFLDLPMLFNQCHGLLLFYLLDSSPFLADILPQRNKGFLSFFYFLRICVYIYFSAYTQNLLAHSRCGEFQDRHILLKGQW